MKTKLTLIGTMAVACAAFQLTAMPTEMETRRAELVVRKLLGFEKAELEVGRKTRSEVAAVAMKLSGEADTEAAKLLLMKGAFVLYVQDGNFEKAAETLDALETAIPDIPPQYVKNMVDAAFLGVRKKKDSAMLYKLLAESKKADAESGAPKAGTHADESEADTRQNAFARLFPGWQTSVEPTVKSNHRGQDDVAFVHPPSQETPAVVSRTLTLSKGNPCLFLKMASFDKGSDFLLSILVNGKEVLPKRLICTPDSAPWLDITVPLFAWRGEKVKIDIVLTANDWWCEHPFFKRLEVAEGTGREKVDPEAIGSETGRQTFSRLFPGWQASVEPVARPNHRGQNDVVFVHPRSQETPAVVSRTLTLSKGNPCLFLKMASFDKGSDFLLSVLVNGKEVLPKRPICTPDSEPWQDITVPLSAWRGSEVKIEVVLTANGWWCEHPFFKRLEVAEGARQEKFAPEAKDIKYKFSYKLEDEFAVITGVEPKPVGKLVVPYEIDGHTVVQIGGGYNDNMFSDCDQMTGIVLPAGLELETFDPGVFMRCKSLASIEVSKANLEFASLDGVLYSKDFSMLCVYPKTRDSISLSPMTKSIMRCAFRGCALKTAKIPEGIEEIERWNLCECPNLKSVEFPKSLKRLDCCAVAHSENVEKMVFNGDAPRVDPTYYTSGLAQSLFTGAPTDLVVEVREGTKGWMSQDSAELPERWPTDQKESRPIRYME